MVKTSKKLVHYLVALGLMSGLASVAASAAERSHIWVHELKQNTPVKLEQSNYADELRDALVQPWVSALPTGQKLTQKKGEVQHLPLLQLPVAVERFTQGKLSVKGAENATFYLNGEKIKGAGSSAKLNFQTGDHQVLILLEGVENWDEIDLKWEGQAETDVLNTEAPNKVRLSQKQMFDTPSVNQVSLSPNGQYLIWNKQFFTPETGNQAQNETEILNLKSKQTVYRWDTGVYGFAWHKTNQQLAFIQQGQVKLLDLNTLKVETLTLKLAGVQALKWADEKTLLFSWNKKGEQDGPHVKHYQALEDRWTYFRDNSQIYSLSVPDKTIGQLTQGESSSRLLDVHTDGRTLLVSRSVIDYSQPPHSKSKLQKIDRVTGETTELGEFWTFNQAVFVGDDIYIVAGPEFADGMGRNLPDGWLANNYDGQLYRYSDSGQVTALSKNFAPAIGSIRALSNGNLLLSVTDKDTTQLYHYRVKQKDFAKINTGLDEVASFTFSEERTPQLVVAGTGVTQPSRMLQLKIGKKNVSELWNSDAYFKAVDIAPVQDWNFVNAEGDTIHGRVYRPPFFDESKTYPALVYYYGGTTPVQRSFTGRYPFNQWAAQGYVVYVLQPSGATGFGQKFSARHVNAWGEYTADDIIQGTQAFLKAHPFVDAKKVGHLGASYGGFMTMLLATKTDIFAASMSHAGISNISSYWGAGWWGFLYSGEATKGSFPWNNPTLYSQNSPVYHADKVTAPMLLIHGDSDTNVPPVESQTMYTALKVLGKDVELVEFKGEDHHILPRDKRLLWWDTYMAFFDKHLKGEPEWWDSLYPNTVKNK